MLEVDVSPDQDLMSAVVSSRAQTTTPMRAKHVVPVQPKTVFVPDPLPTSPLRTTTTTTSSSSSSVPMRNVKDDVEIDLDDVEEVGYDENVEDDDEEEFYEGDTTEDPNGIPVHIIFEANFLPNGQKHYEARFSINTLMGDIMIYAERKNHLNADDYHWDYYVIEKDGTRSYYAAGVSGNWNQLDDFPLVDSKVLLRAEYNDDNID